MEKLGINVGILITQVLNFAILLFLLHRFLYKPILNMLSERRERIREGLAEAERVRAEAEEQRKQYEQELAQERQESQARIQKAMKASEEARGEIIAEARKEAEQIKARAREEIEYERRQALEQLRTQVADLSILAAKRILDGAIDEGVHRQLVQGFIDQELDKELT
ncbi:MAG: F0F1 ATP synthase subunit B [Anaerolineae bacterium]